MIPKIIHYCWFGKNPLTETAEKCIASWKKYCPEYEIKEWNESNFDLNCCEYVKEAYEAKKWAFVTDYVRLFALANEGGIYMDTDVEVIRPLDDLLGHSAFSGFESEETVPTGIIAAEKEHAFIYKLMDEYSERRFVRSDGSYDLTTNVVSITQSCIEAGFEMNNTQQTINQFTLYPKDFFCPKSYATGVITITDNTYTIHHFSGSWQSNEVLLIRRIEEYPIRLFGVGIGRSIGRLMSFPIRILKKVEEIGLSKTILFAKDKIRKALAKQ